MEFEYDEAKDAANLQRHGLSLRLGRVVYENRIADAPGKEGRDGETRYLALGLVKGRLLACVYTIRGAAGDVVRIISVRPASKQERRKWAW